jgi:membrane protease YdiL (CAAX protease family)
MSANLASKLRRLFGAIITLIGESSWVLFCFFVVAALVFGAVVSLLPSVEQLLESTLGQLVAGGVIYGVVLLVVVLPVWIFRGTSYVQKVLGLGSKPTRSIWWLPLLMWAAYMAVTIIVSLATSVLPWVDVNQEQEVGFKDLSQPFEYVIAFVALVILPPIAEELLFRGYLFGRLRERFGFWLTTVVVSIVFGIVHLQWNVGIDVAVLSVFLCYLREKTGSVWASMVLHAIKNGLAYFLLFIAPLLGFNLLQ